MMSKKKSTLLIILLIVTLSLIYIITVVLNKNKLIKNEKYDEVVKVEIWSIQGGSIEALDKVTSGYKDIYPNVEFIIKGYENQAYKRIIKDTLVTNEGPDIFFSWGYDFLNEFVQADRILDITQEIKGREYEKKMKKNALEAFTINNKIYGIPTQGFDTVIYINKNIFEKYNVNYPETYDELLVAIEIFNENGIIPISIGGVEPWMLSQLYMSLVIREVGIDEVKSSFEANKYFENEGFKIAGEKMIQLINMNAFGDEFLTDTINQSVYRFITQDSAMTLCGSYASNTIESMIPDKLDNIDVISFPLTSDKSNLNEGVAGYTDTFVINKFTQNKELVLDIYMRLIKDLSEEQVKNGTALPVWIENNYILEESKLLYKCSEVFPVEGYHEPYDIIFSKELADIHLNSIVEFTRGDIDLDEFLKRHKSNLE